MDRKTFLKLTAGSTAGLTAYLAACSEAEDVAEARSADGAPEADADEDADEATGAAGPDGSGRADSRGLDAPVGQRMLPVLGIQLYTLRKLVALDMSSVLAEVASAGYAEVEFAGYFDESPERIREMADEFRLDPVSAHVPIEVLRSDFDSVVAAAETVGHRYVVVPYLAEEERTSADDYRRLAQELNELGERCQAAGVTLGYHNHAFELAPFDHVRGLDVMLDDTDPALVTFEMDLFWIVYGGGDPAAYLRNWPGRFRLCHVKDMDRNRRMVDVGDGTIDWGAIFDAAKTGGIEHFLVEHDDPSDPVATSRRSYEFLSRLTF